MKVKIQYFAMLRESSGKDDEQLEVESMSIDSLYLQLKEQYGFKISIDDIRFAVNDEFVEKSYELSEQDDIVFIPPVGGG
jgi:sulfur-carrier protein